MKTSRRFVPIVAAVLMLAGCASAPSVRPAAQPGPAPSTSASPSPSVSPSASAPTAVATCDQLSSAAAVGALLGHDVAAVDAHVLDLGADRTIYLLESVGGVACAWGDPVTASGGALGFRGVVVRVLPHAAATWDRLAGWFPETSAVGAAYGEFGSRGGFCDGGAKVSSCQTNVLVGENWLAVTAKSATPSFTQDAFHQAVQQMVPPLEDVLATPKSTVAVVGQPACASQGYEDAVASSFDIPVAAYRPTENIFRIEAAASQIADSEDCSYWDAADGSGDFVTFVAFVPDAGQQLADYRGLLKAQKLAIDTVPIDTGHTTATGRSYDRYGTAWYDLDFELRGSWVTVATRDSKPGRAHAATLAKWILARDTQ